MRQPGRLCVARGRGWKTPPWNLLWYLWTLRNLGLWGELLPMEAKMAQSGALVSSLSHAHPDPLGELGVWGSECLLGL